jgi:bifunctional non-homologous end joining protein LigD
VRWKEDPAKVRPMLATLADPPLTGAGLVFEPKYDGIRALVHVAPRQGGAEARLWSRLGNDKTAQFPSIIRALERWGTALTGPVLLDGEIVALEDGKPAGFQRLQGRIHLTSARDVEIVEKSQPVALIAFDILRDGDDDVRGLPLTDRRARLEKVLRKATGGKRTGAQPIRISEQVAADGRALHARAMRKGWEGLIVKEARAPYQSGRRSPAWRKLKVVRQQEFVIGGWTEPRQSRQYFGALLLGVQDAQQSGSLQYVGHTGTGFNQKELGRVSALLKALETKTSPFAERIRTNEPAHWVKPELVAEIRFSEWTNDQKLRHPVYLGLRDDKKAADVVKEAPAVRTAPAARASGRRGAAQRAAREREARGGGAPRALKAPAARASGRRGAAQSAAREREARGGGAPRALKDADKSPGNLVVDQLRTLEDARKDGTLELPGGLRLPVTNLAKPFWPKLKLTKGDLLRYYAEVAPYILPAVADRPLVMKRFPNGIDGKAFYQQRSRQENPPAGVRIETIADDIDPILEPDARRFIGGSLITLLHMTQIAAISQDPWFSRVQSPLDADYVAIDLDPGEGTTFATVLEVARLVHDELALLKVPSVPKTSGSSGLHIYIPLAPGTTYESGMLFCQIVATVVASRHPRIATVERSVRARRTGTVYVDYLQNILGKTLATAYSARASEYAGVSTPLAWKEVFEDIDPRDFTIVSAPARFRRVGDLWAKLRTGKPADLETVFKKYSR